MHIRKTAIVILTYNNIAYNKACLESIREHTEVGSYEIVVVDNNSSDGTREWLMEQHDVKLQLNDYNAGFPKGCNQGIALACEDSDILLLNNDTIVMPRWLENMSKCLYSADDIGAVGAVCNHNENLQGVDFSYGDPGQMMALAEENNISDSSRWEQKLFLIGYCLLIKREVLDKIGPLDEAFSPGYIEDNDLCMRIVTAGYRLMLCHDCFIHHHLGTSFRANMDALYPILFANREKFRMKWGFGPFLFDDIKHTSIRVLDEADRQKPLRVLDYACGIGVTLLKIKYRYPNALLFGWEPCATMANIARRVAVVSTAPFDHFIAGMPDGSFDYILLGQYLETVENPEKFLSVLKSKLRDGGCVICAVQNIMHYSVIRDMLAGHWHYPTETVVNKNYKNLFTLSDLTDIFSRCGYKNQHTFHWYSAPSDVDWPLINQLCEAGEEKRSYIYTTYLFSVRFQK